jgi:hypothetical protein
VSKRRCEGSARCLQAPNDVRASTPRAGSVIGFLGLRGRREDRSIVPRRTDPVRDQPPPCAEFSVQGKIVRLERLKQGPVASAVVHLSSVQELVKQRVPDEVLWEEDESQVETDRPLRRATRPPGLL